MTATRTVWGMGTPRTVRPLWALIELGLNYEHRNPPIGLSETYGAAPVAVDAAKRMVDRQLQEAARWLENGRAYVTGQQFGVVDILLTTCLEWARLYGLNLPELLGDYRERIASRPGYEKAMAQNGTS